MDNPIIPSTVITREDFNKWYMNNPIYKHMPPINNFHTFPFDFKMGVYISYLCQFRIIPWISPVGTIDNGKLVSVKFKGRVNSDHLSEFGSHVGEFSNDYRKAITNAIIEGFELREQQLLALN